MRRLRFMSLILWLCASTIGLASPAKDEYGSPTRPPLEIHQGMYFMYAMPAGWRANETTNGVDMYAPDGKTLASAVLLIGGYGPMTPRAFMEGVARAIGITEAKVLWVKDLPDQPGLPGQYWKVVEAESSYTIQGTPVRGHAVCGINQSWGQYNAVMFSHQAPEQNWERDKYWLPKVAHSVVITNPRQVAGRDQVQLPRNIPYDYIYGGTTKAWEARGIARDRISQAWREATMGYDRLKDPKTGRTYELPLEMYDPTRGGYRNPMRPDELLVKTNPGE